MGHPLIDEFCHVKGLSSCRPAFFSRCQQVFRDEVQPRLEQCDRLEAENLELKTEVDRLRARNRKAEAVPA